MVRSCVSSFPDLTFLFYGKTTPPLSPPKPRACDLTAIPYASWQPPTCPQKCEGLCPHLPAGVETRVNGQLVSAPISQTVLTTITEEGDGRENVSTVAKQANTAGKAGGASSLTVSAPAVPEVYVGGGERTPDLSSLLSDDGSEHVDPHAEPVDQHAERLVKNRSGLTTQLTNDWLATLPSVPDADIEPDDNASALALDDAEGDNDEVFGAKAEHDHPPFPEYVLTADPTTYALSLPSVAIDEAAYADVDLNTEDNKLDPQLTDECYLWPHSVPAAEDVDVWCEIAASPTVVADVSATPSAHVGETDAYGKEAPEENLDEDTEGKPARPLSHVFFF
jgi:hypothetical protein